MVDISLLRTADFWRQRASELVPDSHALIDGERVESIDGATFDCLSSIDGRRLAAVAACAASDVDSAVASARAAFSRGDWAEQSPTDRKKVLLRFADLIERHVDELALLETHWRWRRGCLRVYSTWCPDSVRRPVRH